MIKVLMVGNSPSVKGGITTVINQFRNYDLKKDNIKLKFIPTYIDKNNFVKLFYFMLSYIRIIFSTVFYKPDIIHIHMSYRGSFTRAYLIQRVAIKHKIKNIIHLHGSEFEKWYNLLNDTKKEKVKKLMRNSDSFIVLGDIWDRVIKKIEPKTKTIILNNSVTIPNKIVDFKNNKTFVFLGVLIKRKGVNDLIEALKHTQNDNYSLLIAGSGEEEKELKKKVLENNIKNVEFLGWIDKNKKEELLLKSQYMILPSYNEGLPMSILEAMSYGIPVISTYVGDIPTVISNKINGFLFNPGNVDELSKIIDNSIALDEEEWNQLSKNARSTIVDSFSEELYFKKINSLYKKLSKNK